MAEAQKWADEQLHSQRTTATSQDAQGRGALSGSAEPEATEPETFLPQVPPSLELHRKPLAPPGWPPKGRNDKEKAEWLMTHYPTPEGGDPLIIGNLAPLPQEIPMGVWREVWKMW